jgi:hypothetical protein
MAHGMTSAMTLLMTLMMILMMIGMVGFFLAAGARKVRAAARRAPNGAHGATPGPRLGGDG